MLLVSKLKKKKENHKEASRIKCTAEGQHIDVEELVCLWVWKGKLVLTSEVVWEPWVRLWVVGVGLELGRSQEQADQEVQW